VIAAALVTLTLAAYASVLAWGGFVWDDNLLLTENRVIASPDGLGLFWAAGKSFDYLPLTWSTLWLEWRAWGASPTGYHVTNVLLHAASVVMVYLLLRRLKVPGAILAAAIFAVHPVNVASVAWISERKNTLSMLLYLLTILAFLRFDDRRRWTDYGLALLLFAAALLSKSSVVCAPLVLAAILWWRHSRLAWRGLLAVAPFLLLSVAGAIVTVHFQNTQAIGESTPRPEGFLSRLAVAGMAPWFYLSKDLLPTNLAMIYPRWTVAGDSVRDFLPGLAILAGLAALVMLRKKPWARATLLAAVYFLLSLLPVLGFLQMSFHEHSLVADHWQYLAILGPIALLSAAAWRFASRLPREGLRLLCVAGFSLIVAILTLLTWRQGLAYRNANALWTDTLKANPACPEAYYDLGRSISTSGLADRSVVYFLKAIELRPRYSEAHNNLGYDYVTLGMTELAAEHFARAVEFNPSNIEARFNLAQTLCDLGRTKEAAGQYRELSRQTSNWLARPMANFARILASADDPSERNGAEALRWARRACQVNKYQNPMYLDTLAMALAETGQFDQAVQTANQARSIAQQTGKASLAGEVSARIELYRQHRPYREGRPQTQPARQVP
jgi:tetratricopeptide (TPR) repeat protein